MIFLNSYRNESTPGIAAAQGKGIHKKLTLIIPASDQEEIKFNFDPIASVIYGSDTVKIELHTSLTSKRTAKCHIAGYCVSDVDPNVVTRVRYGNTPDINLSKVFVPENDGSHKRLSPDTTCIFFDISLKPGHLIFIGLIVAVEQTNGKYKDHLFDPQLGNGPPAPEGLSPAPNWGQPDDPGSSGNKIFGTLIPLE